MTETHSQRPDCFLYTAFAAIETTVPPSSATVQFLNRLQAGQLEELISHLPGNPDNVNRAADGSYWVALPAQKGPLFKLMQYKVPYVRMGHMLSSSCSHS